MAKSKYALLAGATATCALMLGLIPAGANDSVIKGGQDPNQWAVYGKDYANTRFSPLKSINTGNVSHLTLAYSFQLGSLRSNESTPLVIGDTMYVSTSWGPKYVYAIDAATGARKWTYEPDMPDDVLQFACCDVNSRGVTYADGKIFVGRLDGKLVALDAQTGKELWKADVDRLHAGRGHHLAAAGGQGQGHHRLRRRRIRRARLAPGLRHQHGQAGLEDLHRSAQGRAERATRGKATRPRTAAARPGSLAPTIRRPTPFSGAPANPGPWNTAVRSTGNGDFGKLTNLYTASTLALDADTGKIKWWVQGTPADAWDYDGVNELVLADLKIDGETVPAMMKADRNGFFFVVNRETGKVLSAEKYVPTTWAEKWDVDTGRAVEVADKRAGPNHPAKGVCPNLIGGKNWQPMSYNPETGLVYIPSNNVCMDWSVSDVNYKTRRLLSRRRISPA